MDRIEGSMIMDNAGCACACGCASEVAAVHECVAAADALLAQTGEFVSSLDDGVYGRLCGVASGGTIGKHVRHLLDHFSAVLKCGEGDGAVIDYDHRERGGAVETSRAAAAGAIEELRLMVMQTGSGELDAPVAVRVMVSSDGRTVDLWTTIGRELAFATHHALHHHAMMRVIAASFGVGVPDELGMAPATVWGGAGGKRCAR